MRTIWHSLAWKEWHEHKWKLASLMAILLGVLAVLFFSTERDAVEVYFGMLVYMILPFAIFLGASEAADERGRGTLPLIQSLPEPMWKHACWKLGYGVATCLTPIVISLLILVALCSIPSPYQEEFMRALRRSWDRFPVSVDLGNTLANWTVSSGLLVAIVGVSIYLWTAAVGVNRKDQVRTGAAALLAIVVCWTAVGFTVAAVDHEWLKLHGSPLGTVVFGISPGGLALALAIAAGPGTPVLPFSVMGAIAVAVAFHVALAAWFVIRFGRTEDNDNYSPQASGAQTSSQRWMGLPRRHALTAIAWKQFRESTPIVLVGLAAIAFFFAANLLTSPEYYATYEQRAVELLASLTMVIGFIVATAVGVGVFDRDLGPNINEFWRSRPIHPDLWFWTKFLTGLCVMLAALFLPLFLGWLWTDAPFVPRHRDARMMLLLLLAVYATALAGISLVRQPVYAAILGVGTLLIGIGLVLYFFGPQAIEREATVFAIESATAVLATLVAWLAVRYDWGRKSGY